MKNIPMVEGVIVKTSDDGCYGHPNPCAITLPHGSRKFGRALVETFSPGDEVVVIRKSDFEQLERLAGKM